MKLLLTAPFNSEINLSTFQAYRNQSETIEHLAILVRRFNQGATSYKWILHWQQPDESASFFKSLDENHLSNASKPILEVGIDDLVWLKEMVNNKLPISTIENFNTIKLVKCSIFLYDNTISILSLEIEDSYNNLQFESIDHITFEICQIILNFFKPVFIEMIDIFRLHPYFLVQVGSNNIFNRKPYVLYWVNRSLIINNNNLYNSEEQIRIWCKLYNNDYIKHDYLEFEVYFCVGNSIIVTENCLPSKYQEAINLSTYFYCVYFSINNRVSRIFEDIENTAVFENNYKLLYEIERLVIFLDNQHETIIFSLQGETKSIVKNFYNVWNLEDIRSILNYKISKVYELYKFERLQKSERVSRIVQGALTLIGASAIVDVVLNIILFSHEDFINNFTSFGLTYILTQINPDFILLLSFILLIWLAVIVTEDINNK